MDEQIRQLTLWDPVKTREASGTDLVLRSLLERAREGEIDDPEGHAETVAHRMSQLPVIDGWPFAAVVSALIEGGAHPSSAATLFFEAVHAVLADARVLLRTVPPKNADPVASARESSIHETMLRAHAGMGADFALRRLWAWESVDEWCVLALPVIVACADEGVEIPFADGMFDAVSELSDYHIGARGVESALFLAQFVEFHRNRKSGLGVLKAAEMDFNPSMN